MTERTALYPIYDSGDWLGYADAARARSSPSARTAVPRRERQGRAADSTRFRHSGSNPLTPHACPPANTT